MQFFTFYTFYSFLYKTVMNFEGKKNKHPNVCVTYSGPLPGLVGHTEGLMAVHTWKESALLL